MNLFIASSAFCPGLPNHDPMDSEKHLPTQWNVTGDVLTRLPAKHTKIGMRVSTLSNRCSNNLRISYSVSANSLLILFTVQSYKHYLTNYGKIKMQQKLDIIPLPVDTAILV